MLSIWVTEHIFPCKLKFCVFVKEDVIIERDLEALATALFNSLLPWQWDLLERNNLVTTNLGPNDFTEKKKELYGNSILLRLCHKITSQKYDQHLSQQVIKRAWKRGKVYSYQRFESLMKGESNCGGEQSSTLLLTGNNWLKEALMIQIII